jgi:iron(III) transport system substrate-binding protein
MLGRFSTVGFLLLCLLGSCDQATSSPAQAGRVVVYTAVDEPIARPILDEFAAQTGIELVIVTDAEASKTAGLAARLEAEKANPQADVWWGNEVFYTINLAEQGVLEAYSPPVAADIPRLFRDAQSRWHGVGLRARVIAAAPGVEVDELSDLTDARLKGRIAMARPSAGTTGGHVAALYVLWGPDRARQFFRDMRANEVHVLGGNGQVAEQVARGALSAGLTDNDDVANARQNIGPVEPVLPDQQTTGTLMMPTTVGLVGGAPHPEAAKKLIDYLLSAQVEARLKQSGFCLAAVREAGQGGAVRAMEVEYAAVARIMPQAIREATSILEGRE